MMMTPSQKAQRLCLCTWNTPSQQQCNFRRAECWCRVRECPWGSITEPPQVLSAFISCLLEQTLLPQPRCGCCIVPNLWEMPFSPLLSLMITRRAFSELSGAAVCCYVVCEYSGEGLLSHLCAFLPPRHELFSSLPPDRLTRRPGVGMPRQGGGWSALSVMETHRLQSQASASVVF